MKLLLDQGLPRSAAHELRLRGFEVVHTGDIGLATASDQEILRHAQGEGQSIVTLDGDFHSLLALSGAASPSVVRVRIQGLRGEQVAALVERVIALCDADLRSGAMATVDEHSIRVRALPLVR